MLIIGGGPCGSVGKLAVSWSALAFALTVGGLTATSARASVAVQSTGTGATASPSEVEDQTAPEDMQTGDIVVTARRREENLQDVPVSVIAFSQDRLTENAVASAADLGRVAPGLVAVPSSGNPVIIDFAIRGRGLNFGAAAGSVETYFSEVPLSPPFQMPQLPPQFFDLSSLQVLKGPQGTLFGRSTTGGAVLIQPQAPTNEYEGYGRVQVGNFDNLQLEGALNIPVIDDVLAIRLAGFRWSRNGYARVSPVLPDAVQARIASDASFRGRLFGAGTTFVNGDVIASGGRTVVDNGIVVAGDTGLPVDRDDYNNQDVTELRGSVRLTPFEGLENTTVVTYHRDHNRGNTTGGLLLVRGPTGAPAGSEPTPGFGTYTGFLSSPPVRPPSHSYAIINTTGLDLTDALTVRNIFGYINAQGYVLDGYDPDGSPARTIDTYVGREKKQEQLTNELQLQGTTFDNRLDFTIGGLIDKLSAPKNPNKLNTASVSGNTTVAPDPGHPNSQAFLTRYLSTDIDSYALYVAATFRITDALSVAGGYRHTWDTVEGSQAVSLSRSIYLPETFQDANPDIPGLQQVRNLRRKFESDVYNVTVDYRLTPDALLYAGYRRGFKRGGFNSSAFGAFPPGFDPEKIDSYSAGAKATFDLGETRLRFNVEGFYDKYKGFQASYLLLDFATFNLLTLTANIPKVRYYGLDADVGADLADWLDFTVNYSYLNADIQRFPDITVPGSTIDLAKNEVTYAPKHQLRATARFHGEVADVGEWVLQPSVSYRSKFFTTLFNRTLPASQLPLTGGFAFNNLALGGATVEGVTLVDLRAEINNVAGSRFGVAVGATNLLDEFHTIGNSGTLSFGIQGTSIGPPRLVYGEVSYRF